MLVTLPVGKHPVYRSIVKYPPKGIKYITNYDENTFRTLKVYRDPNKFIMRSAVLFLKISHIPRVFYYPKSEDSDLIFSTRGILLLNKFPWITDCEYVKFFGENKSPITRKIVLNIIRSKWCKKILFLSNVAKHIFTSGWKLNENEIINKFDNLYPAMEIIKSKTKKKRRI